MNILAGLFSVSTPKRGDIGASDVSISVYFMYLHFLYLWISAAIVFVPRTRVVHPSTSAREIWRLAYFVFAFFMVLQLVFIASIFIF